MKALVNGQEVEFNLVKRDADGITLVINEREYHYPKNDFNFSAFDFDEKSKQVFVDGLEATVQLLKKTQSAQSSGAHAGSLLSPMPGKIFKVVKAEGSSVKAGETILIMEAMKMEHAIKANKDGVVKKIFFKEGDQVKAQSQLLELE